MSADGIGAQSALRIACLQMEPMIGMKEANVEKSRDLIQRACADGARLVVLPELCNTGYVFESRAEAFALSEPIPEGPTTKTWAALARQHRCIIVAGICERDHDALYNSAIVLGPEGHIGTFRKNHLWGEENLFFEPGNLGIPVWNTSFGRLAVAICYDAWFPETFRLAALQGADIMCIPTNWVPMPEQPTDCPVMANILAMAGAHSNSLFVAAADRVGIERGQAFLGCSLIVNHTGFPLAGPASADQEEIIFADVNVSDARRKRALNSFNQLLRDRRTDIYGEMLGSRYERGWY